MLLVSATARDTNHVTLQDVRLLANVCCSSSIGRRGKRTCLNKTSEPSEPSTREDADSLEDKPTPVLPWPYLEGFFQMVGCKNNSFRRRCKLCAPKSHEPMAFKTSPSNLKKHIEASTEPPQDQASCGSSQDEAPAPSSQFRGSSLPNSQQQDESSLDPAHITCSSHSSSSSSANSSPSLHASLDRESISMDQTTYEWLESTSTPRPALKKRRRQQQLDDFFSDQIARIDRRRKELSERLQKDDEYDRFGQMLADLLRRVPEHKQVVARRNLISCVCDLLED
ncbi:uncharacterized protein [Nothobranchius furzeri]|uniref:Transcript variant X1 n=2 Tax=Nothobranchius furzeri TaxID=105023 RepID=A0A9D3BFU5_NOTFU|nr:transcript variant X1 [Nothobranchius furzeri]